MVAAPFEAQTTDNYNARVHKHAPSENPDQTATLLHVREIHHYNDWIWSFLQPFVRGHVVEVGCGIGTYSTRLRPLADRLTCIDMEPAYARTVRRHFAADDGVDVLLARLPESVGLRPAGTDLVVCLNVLEHIAKADEAVAAMRTWLRPGGHLFLQVPAHNWLYGSIDSAVGHQQRYRADEVNAVLTRHGFVLERPARHLYALGIPGWWWFGRVAHRTLVPEGSVRLANTLVRVSRALEHVVRLRLGLTLVAAGRRA